MDAKWGVRYRSETHAAVLLVPAGAGRIAPHGSQEAAGGLQSAHLREGQAGEAPWVSTRPWQLGEKLKLLISERLWEHGLLA